MQVLVNSKKKKKKSANPAKSLPGEKWDQELLFLSGYIFTCNWNKLCPGIPHKYFVSTYAEDISSQKNLFNFVLELLGKGKGLQQDFL